MRSKQKPQAPGASFSKAKLGISDLKHNSKAPIAKEQDIFVDPRELKEPLKKNEGLSLVMTLPSMIDAVELPQLIELGILETKRSGDKIDKVYAALLYFFHQLQQYADKDSQAHKILRNIFAEKYAAIVPKYLAVGLVASGGQDPDTFHTGSLPSGNKNIMFKFNNSLEADPGPETQRPEKLSKNGKKKAKVKKYKLDKQESLSQDDRKKNLYFCSSEKESGLKHDYIDIPKPEGIETQEYFNKTFDLQDPTMSLDSEILERLETDLYLEINAIRRSSEHAFEQIGNYRALTGPMQKMLDPKYDFKMYVRDPLGGKRNPFEHITWSGLQIISFTRKLGPVGQRNPDITRDRSQQDQDSYWSSEWSNVDDIGHSDGETDADYNDSDASEMTDEPHMSSNDEEISHLQTTQGSLHHPDQTVTEFPVPHPTESSSERVTDGSLTQDRRGHAQQCSDGAADKTNSLPDHEADNACGGRRVNSVHRQTPATGEILETDSEIPSGEDTSCDHPMECETPTSERVSRQSSCRDITEDRESLHLSSLPFGFSTQVNTPTTSFVRMNEDGQYVSLLSGDQNLSSSHPLIQIQNDIRDGNRSLPQVEVHDVEYQHLHQLDQSAMPHQLTHSTCSDQSDSYRYPVQSTETIVSHPIQPVESAKPGYPIQSALPRFTNYQSAQPIHSIQSSLPIYPSQSALPRHPSDQLTQPRYPSQSGQPRYPHQSAQPIPPDRSAELRRLNQSADLRHVHQSADLRHVHQSAELRHVHQSADLRHVHQSADLTRLNQSAHPEHVSQSAQPGCLDHQCECHGDDDNASAPVRLPPVIVHRAGDLPPWAATHATIDLSRACNREFTDLRRRRATYDEHWPHNTSDLDPANMALAGFFCLSGQRVRCFYCGLELDCLAPGDNVWEEHVRHRPDCVYLTAIMGPERKLQTQVKLAQKP